MVFHAIKILKQENIASFVTINKKKTIQKSGIRAGEMPHVSYKLEICPVKTIYLFCKTTGNKFQIHCFIFSAWYRACI